MKTLLIIALALFSFSAFAQGVDFSTATYLHVIPVKVKGKTLVSVDYGQTVSNDKEYGLMENGKLMEFSSLAGVFNYFDSKGYEYVESNNLSYGSQQVLAYLFKKRKQ